MFGWLRRIEAGTTTWRDAQAAVFWMWGMAALGFAAGALLVWLVCKR